MIIILNLYINYINHTGQASFIALLFTKKRNSGKIKKGVCYEKDNQNINYMLCRFICGGAFDAWVLFLGKQK
jgi:hypothetical protein